MKIPKGGTDTVNQRPENIMAYRKKGHYIEKSNVWATRLNMA